MEYLAALALLFLLPFAFMKVYGRRVARFKGPWIVDEQGAMRSGGLVYASEERYRRLVGLTRQETDEFEELDRLSPVDKCGQAITWQSSTAPTSTRETRWLELYLKHQEAQKAATVHGLEIETPRRATAGRR